MKHVFVSYKSENRERVRTLVEALRRSGVPIWWDQDIPTGAAWEEAITQALHEAECVLVCWTTLSTHPKAGAKVQVEAREALDNEKLVQVLLDDAEPPLFFRQFQAANLRNWDGALQHAEFQQLAQAARDILDGKIPDKFAHVGKRKRGSRWLVAAAVLAICAAASPILINAASEAIGFARNMYAANTREDIQLLRVGSPFDDAKPALAPPDFDGVFDTAASAPIAIGSTTAAGLLDAISASRKVGIEPELFAFSNYGVFEVSESVPYRSTTIREAFPSAQFIDVVGPMADRIQSRGWVVLNMGARNAKSVVERALAQRTCPSGMAAENALAQSVRDVMAPRIEGVIRIDLCRLVQHGELLLVVADALVHSAERVGRVSQVAVLRLNGHTPEIVVFTTDSVSLCIFSLDDSPEDCTEYLDRIPNMTRIPAAISSSDQDAAPAPVVRLTSPVEMVNYRGDGSDITWSDFTWQTRNLSAIAYQLVVFDMGGLERVLAFRPAERGAISSGFLMDGEESRWRVISVLHSGEFLATEWQRYVRVDQYPDGERVARHGG